MGEWLEKKQIQKNVQTLAQKLGDSVSESVRVDKKGKRSKCKDGEWK
mgnify:CR=1 FL=1